MSISHFIILGLIFTGLFLVWLCLLFCDYFPRKITDFFGYYFQYFGEKLGGPGWGGSIAGMIVVSFLLSIPCWYGYYILIVLIL